MPLRRLADHGGKFQNGSLFHIPVMNSLVNQHACTRRWHNHLSHISCFSRDYSASTCTSRPPHTQEPPGGIANFVGGTYLCPHSSTSRERIVCVAGCRRHPQMRSDTVVLTPHGTFLHTRGCWAIHAHSGTTHRYVQKHHARRCPSPRP